jgi:hypothetical protein
VATPSVAYFTGQFGWFSASGKVALLAGKGVLANGSGFLTAGIKFGQSSLKIMAASSGIKIAATGFFGKALAALGGLGGPVGLAAGAVLGVVIGKIIEKIDWKKVKKAIPWVLGGILGFGTFSIAGPILGIVVGLGTYGLLAAGTGGGGLGAAAVGGAIALLLARIGKAFMFTVAKPIIVFLIVFPIFVAIVLFIINSGAYIVPPTTTGFGSNPYIQIEKIPSPAGPFENFNLPLSIKYSIKVIAKKGPLTNVVITDSCQVITESGTKECSSGLPTDIPSEISPTSPYTFSYNYNYSGDGYKDSLVVNTLTITADTVDGSQQAITTASIKIGDPPDSCPNDSWPVAGDGGINRVTQGPSSPPGCSHNGYDNAIDIGVSGKTIVAVNSGVVTVGQDSCVGKYIKIASTCGSTKFSVLYGHLGVVGVKDGQTVTMGQALGVSDNTGSCTTGPHLHFEFKTASIPVVQKPYLKRDIPIRCCSIYSCNP